MLDLLDKLLENSAKSGYTQSSAAAITAAGQLAKSQKEEVHATICGLIKVKII